MSEPTKHVSESWAVWDEASNAWRSDGSRDVWVSRFKDDAAYHFGCLVVRVRVTVEPIEEEK